MECVTSQIWLLATNCVPAGYFHPLSFEILRYNILLKYMFKYNHIVMESVDFSATELDLFSDCPNDMKISPQTLNF